MLADPRLRSDCIRAPAAVTMASCTDPSPSMSRLGADSRGKADQVVALGSSVRSWDRGSIRHPTASLDDRFLRPSARCSWYCRDLEWTSLIEGHPRGRLRLARATALVVRLRRITAPTAHAPPSDAIVNATAASRPPAGQCVRIRGDQLPRRPGRIDAAISAAQLRARPGSTCAGRRRRGPSARSRSAGLPDANARSSAGRSSSGALDELAVAAERLDHLVVARLRAAARPRPSSRRGTPSGASRAPRCRCCPSRRRRARRGAPACRTPSREKPNAPSPSSSTTWRSGCASFAASA